MWHKDQDEKPGQWRNIPVCKHLAFTCSTLSPQLPNLVCWLLVEDPSVLWEWLLPGKVFSFFTCCLDAVQTLALAKDQSVDNSSQDHLKVNPLLGGFFYRTEGPLLCTCASWTPRNLTYLAGRVLPCLEVSRSLQTRGRVTFSVLCLTEFHSLNMFSGV